MAVLAASALMFSACSGTPEGTPTGELVPQNSIPSSSELSDNNTGIRPDDGKEAGYQLEMPKDGEEIAVFTTSVGVIKMRLFPDAAPKTVENFKGLIKKGYYDGVIFHRVLKGYIAQSGDPTGTGAGGESIWGTEFEDEFNANLLNLRGSVAMANAKEDGNGSQFFFNLSKPEDFQGWEYFRMGYEQYKQFPQFFLNQYTYWPNTSIISDKVKTLYEEYGGNPQFDGATNVARRAHTVFAQVFEGLDVLDKISELEVDENDKPLEEVVITKAEIQVYHT